MELTRSKIAYNLSVSPHREAIPYGDETITFVFSSDLYRRKFNEKRASNREALENSLTKRFGFTVRPGIIADLKLYITIEKRGFLLLKNGDEILCLEEVVLDGVTLTVENTAE